MHLPGEWIDSCSGGGDALPQPDSFDPQRLKINIIPRVYHPSEKLPLEFWDHRRLAEHAIAVMPLDSAPAAVGFILRDHITGSFLVNYTDQVEEIFSGNKCELTRKIAAIVPFRIPRRRARFTCQSYSLQKLVEDLDARFSSGVPSLVASEEVEVFDWEDENPSPSALISDSEWPNPDPAEAGHLLSSVEHAGEPQLETSFSLTITLPQTSLGHDIFTSPALLQMGFLYSLPTTPASSPPATQMSMTRTTRFLTPGKLADNGRTSSGSKAPREWTNCSSEGGRRRSRTSAAVGLGGPFLCFGAGVLAPFRDLPWRLVPRNFTFSPSQLIAKIEERLPGQAESPQSHEQ